VVISIIAILAALLLPVLGRVKVKAQMKKAQMEAGSIATAIHTYESDYSKFPVSSVGAVTAMSEASRLGEDFTYGTKGVICLGPHGPNALDAGFSTPAGTLYPITSPGGYQTNNAEVMAVLLDMEYWPNPPTGPVPTINLQHAKNPQKTKYLNATMAGNYTSPGIGQDGTYRDPWGNPYIITVDLNYDDKTRDAFYRLQAVSQSSGTAGINGLANVHTPPTPPSGNSDYFECNDAVMVWSVGPDKLIDPVTAKANAGANKDNILSWKPQ